MNQKSNHPTYYELLGVKPSASQAEIRTAFRARILKYHPDRNPDPAAAEYTRMLNEAHAVLADERKRQLYDQWLRASAPGPEEAAAEQGQEGGTRPAPDFCCSRCGTKNSSLRLVAMYYVLSFLVVTYRRAASAIWCQRCMAREAAKWTFLSALLGWWGFPWGPVYTLQALFINAKGGLQPRSNNAALLRAVAYQLYTRGERDEAASALRESLRLEPNMETSEFLKYLEQNGAVSRATSSMFWRAANIAPSGLIIAVAALIIFVLSEQPSGYRAEYKPPPNLATAPETVRSPAEEKVNALVGQLAQLVADDAPVVGTHFEGTREFRDHVLDRSKFDPAQLMFLADQVYVYLKSGTPDSNGFIASAYFNARLFALSVYIVNKITSGQNVSTYVAQVKGLGQDPFLVGWLRASQLSAPYSALLAQLSAVTMNYRPASSVTDLQRDYESSAERLKQLSQKTDTYRLSDPDAYNSLVPIYNAQLRRMKRLAKRLEVQTTAAYDLDLAFNRCIDPAILMSQFNRVELTQTSESKPSDPSDVPAH